MGGGSHARRGVVGFRDAYCDIAAPPRAWLLFCAPLAPSLSCTLGSCLRRCEIVPVINAQGHARMDVSRMDGRSTLKPEFTYPPRVGPLQIMTAVLFESVWFCEMGF